MEFKRRSKSLDSFPNTTLRPAGKIPEVERSIFPTQAAYAKMEHLRKYALLLQETYAELKCQSDFRLGTLTSELELKQELKARLRCGDIKKKNL
jgi:hypothetical protein